MSNFNTSIIKDAIGNKANVDYFGSLKVSEPYLFIASNFINPLDKVQEFSVASTTGTGTIASQYKRSLLNISAGTTGTAVLRTRRVARWYTGTIVECMFSASWVGSGVGVAGHEAIIGLFDDADGMYLGYQGTNFVVGYRSRYVSGFVSPASSGDADVVAVVDMSAYDLTKLHKFRIIFSEDCIGNITYQIYSGGNWVTIHTFNNDGLLTNRTHIGTNISPMSAEVTSVSADIAIISSSWVTQVHGLNNLFLDKAWFNAGYRTVTPGVLGSGGNPIVAYRNLPTFAGYPNKIPIELKYAEFSTASEGLYRVNLFIFPSGTFINGDPGTVGATEIKGNFSAIDAIYSPSYTNTPLDFSADIAKGASVVLPSIPRFSIAIPVQTSGAGSAASSVDFSRLGMVASPGLEVLFTLEEIVAGVGTDTCTWSVSYLDLL